MYFFPRFLQDSYKNLDDKALFLQNFARSYKNYQSWKILADKAFLARFLQDSFKNYVFCKNLGRLTSSARILQEINFSARIFKDLYFWQESCKICICVHLGISSILSPCFMINNERENPIQKLGIRLTTLKLMLD